MQLISKDGKAIPHLGGTGKISGGILHQSITTKMDPALIDQGNLLKSVGRLFKVWFSELIWCSTVQNSVTANSSLLSPTGGVNTIPPIQQHPTCNGFDENNATVKSYENEVNENYSITSKTGTTRTPTSRPQSTTPMTTLTSTIAWRTCTESARTAHLFHSCDCLTLHIPWLKFWAHSQSSSFHPLRTLLDSTSPFLLPLFPLVCPRLPLPPRAVPWAPLHDRHGKQPALLRCRRDWGHLNSFTSHTVSASSHLISSRRKKL